MRPASLRGGARFPDNLLDRRWFVVASLLPMLLAGALPPLVAYRIGSPDAAKLLFALAVGTGVSVTLLRWPFAAALLLCATGQQNSMEIFVLSDLFKQFLQLMLVAGVVLHAQSLRIRLTQRLWDIEFSAILAIAMVLAWAFAPEPLEGTGFLVRMLGSVALAIAISRVTTTKRAAQALMVALIVSSAISALVVISDNMLGTRIGFGNRAIPLDQLDLPTERLRFGGTSATPSLAAKMIAVGAMLATLLGIHLRRFRWPLFAAALVCAFGVTVTAGRAGILALGLFAIWLVWRFRHSPKMLLILVAGLAVVALSPLWLSDSTAERMKSLTSPQEDSTTQFRVADTKIGLDQLWRRPLLGIGPKAFPVVYHSDTYRFDATTNSEHALHNMYLGVAVEFGLVAFVSFLGLLGCAIWSVDHARRRGPPDLRPLAEALEVSLLLFLVTAASGPNHQNEFLWVLLGLALAFGRISLAAGRRDP